jgi:GNAT superfamily N-acetyltransferase
VRLRLPEDLPACGCVLAAVHAADGYPSRWPADTAAWLTPPGLAAAWVAQPASMIVGHVGMVQGVDDPVVSAITGAPPVRLASLTRLFVDPIARGRKLGASLVDTVHAYAATQGCS